MAVKAGLWNKPATYSDDFASLWHMPCGDTLREIIREARPYGHAADLGCGPGYWLETLSDAAEITALDQSKDMLDFARHLAGPKVDYVQQSLSDLALSKPVDFALCLNALMPQSHTDALEMLARVLGAMASSGRLAVVLPSLEALLYSTNITTFWDAAIDHEQEFIREKMDTWIDVYSNPLGYVRNPNSNIVKYWLKDEFEALIGQLGGVSVTRCEKLHHGSNVTGENPPAGAPASWYWCWVLEVGGDHSHRWPVRKFDLGGLETHLRLKPTRTTTEVGSSDVLNTVVLKPDHDLADAASGTGTDPNLFKAYCKAAFEAFERELVLVPRKSAPQNQRFAELNSGHRRDFDRSAMLVSEEALTRGHQTSVGTAVHFDKRSALFAAIAEAYERHAFLECYYGANAAVEIQIDGCDQARFFDISPATGLRTLLCLYENADGGSLGLASGAGIDHLSHAAFCEAVQSQSYRLSVQNGGAGIQDPLKIKTNAQRAAVWGDLKATEGLVSRLVHGDKTCGGTEVSNSVAAVVKTLGQIWFRRMAEVTVGRERIFCYRVWCPDLLAMLPSEALLRAEMSKKGLGVESSMPPHPFV